LSSIDKNLLERRRRILEGHHFKKKYIFEKKDK
jgi:hypothetical protein